MRTLKYIYVLFVIFVLMSSFIYSQNNVIEGRVIDDKTGLPVSYAAVTIKGTISGTDCNADGYFRIAAKLPEATLIIFKLGYHTLEYKTGSAPDNVIRLKSKINVLEEVVITSKKIDTLQANSRTLYLAFEFYDNFILALVNKGNAYNFTQLLDEEGKIISQKKAPKGAESLYKDCFGNVHLLSEDSSYQFYYDYEKIVYLSPFTIREFNFTLRPCQCIFRDNYYFKEITYRSLKNSYYYVKKNDPQKRIPVANVNNTEAITAFNQDYDLNYFLNERRKSGSYGTSVDELQNHLDELREGLILPADYKMLLDPARSVLVKKDSSLFIVDFTHKIVSKHSFLGGLLRQDTIPLSGLEPCTIQDVDTRDFYFVNETEGVMKLYRYSERMKKYDEKSVKEFKFVKNVRCRNKTLYFLDKDPLSKNDVMKIFKYKL